MIGEKMLGRNFVKKDAREKCDAIRSRTKTLKFENTNYSSTRSIFLIAIALLLTIILSSNIFAMQNLMPLQGTAYNNGTAINNGNLTVTIWTQASGGSPIYNSSNDFNGVINGGVYDIILGNTSTILTLDYGTYYYIDISINGVDLDFNGSERRILESSLGNISKNYVSNNGSWSESEIPSLTNSWSGTLNATKIVSSSLLNVNSSIYAQYLGGISVSSLLLNDTNIDTKIDNLNNSKSGIGSKICAAGTVLQNITVNSSGVFAECVIDQSGSSPGFNSVSSSELYNQSLTIYFNQTANNLTISAIASQYNDSTKINNVNSSSNIKNLGFNLTSELQSLFDLRYLLQSTFNSENTSLWSAINSRYLSSNANSLVTNISNINTSLMNQISLENSDNSSQNITLQYLVSSNVTLNSKVDNLNSSLTNSKASVGSKVCAAGTMLQNVTSNVSGVFGDCISASGSGTVTSIVANGSGLLGGSVTSSGSFALNDSYVNSKWNDTVQIINVNSSLMNQITLENNDNSSQNISIQQLINSNISNVNNIASVQTNISNLNTSLTNSINGVQSNVNSIQTNISNVNSSGNIKSLGFNLTNELQSIFYNQTYINANFYLSSNVNSLVTNISNVNSSLVSQISLERSDNSSQNISIQQLVSSNISIVSLEFSDNSSQNISLQQLVSSNVTLNSKVDNLNSSLTNSINGVQSNVNSIQTNISNLNSSLTNSKVDKFTINCSSGFAPQQINLSNQSWICVSTQSNPFNQSLNNSDSPTFNNLTLNNFLKIGELLINNTLQGFNLARFHGNRNGYVQINVVNYNLSGSASADIVATSGIGTESDYYIAMGITSPNFNDTNYAISRANISYIQAYNTSLEIVVATQGYNISFGIGNNDSLNDKVIITNETVLINNSLNVTTSNFTVGLNGVKVNGVQVLTGSMKNSIRNLKRNNTLYSASISNTALATQAATANSVRAYPIAFEGQTIDQIVVRSTLGVGITTQNCSFGLYNSTFNNTLGVIPGVLLFNSTNIDMNLTGTVIRLLNFSSPITLRNDTYWFAYTCQGIPTLTAIAVAEQSNILGQDTTLAQITMIAYAKTYNSTSMLDTNFNISGQTQVTAASIMYAGFRVRTDVGGSIIG